MSQDKTLEQEIESHLYAYSTSIPTGDIAMIIAELVEERMRNMTKLLYACDVTFDRLGYAPDSLARESIRECIAENGVLLQRPSFENACKEVYDKYQASIDMLNKNGDKQ